MTKSSLMKRLDEYFEVQVDQVLFFIKHVCIIGVTPISRVTQPRTRHQLYDVFVKTIKLFYRHLSVYLGFNFDDNGKILSDHDIFIRCKVLTFQDFCIAADEILGAAHYGNRPTGKAYGYPNLVVKDPLIYWLFSPDFREKFKDFDLFIQRIDQMNTIEECSAAVDCFGYQCTKIVADALFGIDEKAVVALQLAKSDIPFFDQLLLGGKKGAL